MYNRGALAGRIYCISATETNLAFSWRWKCFHTFFLFVLNTKTAFTMFGNNGKPLPKALLQSPTHQLLHTSSFDRYSSQHMCQNRLQRKPASVII